MNPSESAVWTFTKLSIASFAAYWAGLGVAVQTLLLLMLLDLATGLVASASQQQLNSKTAGKGLAKKGACVIGITVMHVISDRAGNHMGLPMPLDLGDVTAWYCVLNEWISVTENCHKLGMPIPERVLSLLKIAKKLQEPEQVLAEVKANQADAAVALEKAQQAAEVLESLPSAKP